MGNSTRGKIHNNYTIHFGVDSRRSRRSKKSSPKDAPVKSTTTTPEVTEMSIIQEERELQASPVLPPAPTIPASSGDQLTIQLGDDLESSEIRNRLERYKDFLLISFYINT